MMSFKMSSKRQDKLRRLPRALSCLCLLIGGLQLQLKPTLGQQQFASSAGGGEILISRQAINGAHQQVKMAVPASPASQRIGLTPQERPACQPRPQASLRRHLAQAYAQIEPVPGDGPTGTLLGVTSNNTRAASSYTGDTATILSPQITVTSGLLQAAANTNQQQQQQATSSSAKRPIDSTERLRQLRHLLASNNYDAYLVTPNDEHGSEYLAEFDRRLRFISGFAGSNGYALILMDRAMLFTDGRYLLQAEQELDCNWGLAASGDPLADVHLWLQQAGARGLKIAADARLLTLPDFDYLDEHFRKLDCEFALISRDLIDVVWDNFLANNNLPSDDPSANRRSQQQQQQQQLFDTDKPPAKATNQLFVHQKEFAGNVSWQEKVVRLANAMERQHQARHYVIGQLEDIAWLLNLRGSDIPGSPLFKAYLLISRQTSSEQQVSQQQQQQPQQGSVQSTSGGGSSSMSAQQQQTLTTRTTPSLEQLLSSASGGGGGQVLQAPQVLQVPASQTIKLTLYVDLAKISPQVRAHLQLESNSTVTSASGQQAHMTLGPQSRIQVELRDYDVFIMDFRDKFVSSTAALAAKSGGGKLLLDVRANVAIHVLAKNYEDRLLLVVPLIQRMRSVKNELEVNGMRAAHWRDSLAISMLLAQLDADLSNSGSNNDSNSSRRGRWTESSAAHELERMRSLMDNYRGVSFESISAYGANAAIVHYKPAAWTASAAVADNDQQQVPIGNNSTYLLDCGGQYLDGTTDITRTLYFGRPSEFQRETYTRVLMGAIDMMSLIFVQQAGNGSSISMLDDLIARRHLLDIGLDYAHGTGHGIGAYSLVHESPYLIGSLTSASTSAPVVKSQGPTGVAAHLVHNEPISLQANMFTSVEPGYYKANEFGIRLENIVVLQKVQSPQQSIESRHTDERSGVGGGAKEQAVENGQWLRMEPISLVPFEPKLIKFELLSNKQKIWLNSYNLMVRLRMTQQINHYLTKLRHLNETSALRDRQQVLMGRADQRLSSPAAASTTLSASVGPSTSSRLFQQLQQQQQQQQQQQHQTNSTSDLKPIDPARFQALLEQAHAWIMAKTELIALDVPQQAVVGSSSSLSAAAAAAAVDSAAGGPRQSERPKNNNKFFNGFRDQPLDRGESVATVSGGINKWSQLNASASGQRLMLVYMSSMPFNDRSAAQAAASLSGRAHNHLQAPVEAHVNNSTQQQGHSKGKLKCSGIECDLWLLEALNTQPIGASEQHLVALQQAQDRQRAALDVTGAAPANDHQDQGNNVNQEQQPQPGKQQAFLSQLIEMFQLDNGQATDANSSSSSTSGGLGALLVSLWPLLGLASLLLLQLVVMAYVCSGRHRAGTRSRRLSPAQCEGGDFFSPLASVNGSDGGGVNRGANQRAQPQQHHHFRELRPTLAPPSLASVGAANASGQIVSIQEAEPL